MKCNVEPFDFTRSTSAFHVSPSNSAPPDTALPTSAAPWS